MTPEEQRIALAEWDGWKYSPSANSSIKHEAVMAWYRPGNPPWHLEQLPDYLNDLNAVHELEMKMRGTLEQYHNDPVMHRRWKEYQYYLIQRYGASATAEERCEALLKTLNLWKP